MSEDQNRRQSLYSFEKANSSCVFSLAELGLSSVRWNIDFVDNLQKEIARSAFQEGRVKEVGGVLFGTIEAGEDKLPPKPEITVCRFLPVSPQSLVDNENALSDTISEAEKIGLNVVGLYKTQLTLEPEVRARDQTLAEQLLKVKGQFLLSISPSGPRRSVAELFFPGIKDEGENCVIAFPFDREALRRGRITRWQSSKWHGLTFIFRKRIPTLALVACILVAAVLTGIIYRRTNKAATPSTANGSFGLSALSKADHVNVIWNPNGKIISAAKFGILSVVDGTWSRRIIVDRDTLRKGYVAYYPRAKHVEFRLQVAEGSAETAIEATPAASLTPKIPALPVIAKVKPPPPVIAKVKPPLPVIAKVKPPEIRLRETRRQFAPEEPQPKPTLRARPQELPPPPLQNVRVSPPTFSVPEVPKSEPPPPVVAVSRPARVVYVAPESDKRVFPRTPTNVGRLLTSPVTIHVKVKLDEKGNVVRAESQDRATAVEKYLSQLSENAALRWHFTPAMRNNSAAPSETVLEFRFTAQD